MNVQIARFLPQLTQQKIVQTELPVSVGRQQSRGVASGFVGAEIQTSLIRFISVFAVKFVEHHFSADKNSGFQQKGSIF
jgi:hypothetical protein